MDLTETPKFIKCTCANCGAYHFEEPDTSMLRCRSCFGSTWKREKVAFESLPDEIIEVYNDNRRIY